jgi:Type ISP C-terminal specificity domain/NMT1/THI5 like
LRPFLIISAITLALISVFVGVTYWLALPRTVTLAAGKEGSETHRLAVALSKAATDARNQIRFKVVPSTGAEESGKLLEARTTDLAIIRSDLELPPSGQALVINTKRALVLLAPQRKANLSTLADLKGKRIGVVRWTDPNVPLVRRILEIAEIKEGDATVSQIEGLDAAELMASNKVDAIAIVAQLTAPILTEIVLKLNRRVPGGVKLVSIDDPVRYSFRSFDRQWLPPDHRLLSQARAELWGLLSDQQIFATGLESVSPKSGPAITLSNLIPDYNHYKGSSSGRVFPLWRDAAATAPNISPDLLTRMEALYGQSVAPEDVMAYIAALLAHPAFTARFQKDLVRPGLRVPITASAALFAEAANLGREIIWLHCYGERFADVGAGRPASSPRMARGEGPTIPAGGGIPGTPEPLPDVMGYDPATKRLTIGKGLIDNVPQAVWDYDVSGKNVLRQWFSYRRLDRTRPIIGDRRPPSPLDKIQPDHWLDEYTVDLMNLLHVLGRLVALETAQADLLERICAAPLAPLGTPDVA